MITLNDYMHFNNTNQKANSSDMFVNFSSNREKRDTYLHYLFEEIL